MTQVSYFTTPAGEELAILPRRDLDDLRDAVDHAKTMADYRAGRTPGFTADEARALIEAASPLAFWRKHRGVTQTALAARVGVAQNYLSEIESGKKIGDVGLWVRLARELNLTVEDLVDDQH